MALEGAMSMVMVAEMGARLAVPLLIWAREEG